MSDIVTCKAVLRKSSKPGVADELFLFATGIRIISCHPKGTPASGYRPEWEYEERDGRLYITPSLLCRDTNFHTAFNWDVAYELCPEGDSHYELFYELNPDLKGQG